jgi:hypothetical protein
VFVRLENDFPRVRNELAGIREDESVARESHWQRRERTDIAPSDPGPTYLAAAIIPFPLKGIFISFPFYLIERVILPECLLDVCV